MWRRETRDGGGEVDEKVTWEDGTALQAAILATSPMQEVSVIPALDSNFECNGGVDMDEKAKRCWISIKTEMRQHR